jgi:hypothetical protein
MAIQLPTAPTADTDAPAIDGDVSLHLEDLLVEMGLAVQSSPHAAAGRVVQVELVGLHLRVAGSFDLGRFQRLSDFLNNQQGLIELRDAMVLRRNGDPTKVMAPSIWISPTEVTIIGELTQEAPREAPPEFRIPKIAQPMVFVTPGHTMTAEVYIPAGGDVGVFIESPDPAFIPITDARTRSLADRRIIMRYPFAMLNRRHIVAATELLAGMTPGRRVL